MSTKPTVLLGVCGGVAAYKAASVASGLRQRGCEVHVAMTESAAEFVAPLTFSAVSGNEVLTQIFPTDTPDTLEQVYPHLYPSTGADAFVLVPATANTLGKIVQGIGDDIVSCSALSLKKGCRKIICPAMNVEMWDQDSVQHNVAVLEQRGWQRIGPESGHLACGMQGSGRLASPELIIDQVMEALENRQRLEGQRILILSGPTREHLDPVRYFGNPSSGKMGKALAEVALEYGAEVDFVSGPVPNENLPAGANLTTHKVVSAEDMLAAAKPLAAKADVMIYAAAVADYKPREYYPDKMPKQVGDVTIQLTSTPDIAATLGAEKKPHQVSIGFALQSDEGIDQAWGKLQKKHLNGIVLNHTDSLGAEQGNFKFFGAGAKEDYETWGRIDKRVCAQNILEKAIVLLNQEVPV